MTDRKDITESIESKFERIERFESLSCGAYWRAKTDGHNGLVQANQMLMIMAIDDVDGEPHTLHILTHPSINRGSVEYRIDDFMANFEPVPPDEASEERRREVEAIQGQLEESQREMTNAFSDQALLNKLIEEEMPTPTDSSASLPVKYEAIGTDVVGAIQTGKVSNLMSTQLTEKGIEQIKQSMSEQANIAERRAKWISMRTDRLTRIAKSMTPYFEEKAQLALAVTRDTRDHIKKLMDGIGSLNLYVLTDVLVGEVKEGKSAPEDEKLTISQMVQYMDEELVCYQDIDQHFDYQNKQEFFDALASNSGLVEQIFPTARCVVAMATSRGSKNYHNMNISPTEQRAKYFENEKRFLLIRDGENIHYVLSSDFFHLEMPTLFPTNAHNERPFTGFDGSKIKYDDLNYTRALKEHERIALGYKRLLILLCGLDHKHQLFGRFYEGEPSLDFISLEFQEKHMQFLCDVDGDSMLGNYSQVKCSDWIAELNREAGAGSRVLFNWENYIKSSAFAPSMFSKELDYESIKRKPVSEDDYLTMTLKMAKGRLGGSIETESYNFDGKKPKQATVYYMPSINSSDNREIICLDRFNAHDAKMFLKLRSQRQSIPMIRLLKHAIALDESERERLTELRDKLLKDIMAGDVASLDVSELANGMSIEAKADRMVDKARARWRCAHPNKDPLSLLKDNKAYLALCTQIYAVQHTGSNTVGAIRESEESLGRTCLRITINSKGVYQAYSTALEDERDDRLVPHQWVVRTTYSTHKKGVKGGKTLAVLLKQYMNDQETLYEAESDAIESNIVSRKVFFKTPIEKDKAIKLAGGVHQKFEEIKQMQISDEHFNQFLQHYLDVREDMTYEDSGTSVIEPEVIIPFMVLYGSEVQYSVFYTETWRLIAWLCQGDKSRLERAVDAYTVFYENRESNHDEFMQFAGNIVEKPLHQILSMRVVSKISDSSLCTKFQGNTIYRDIMPNKFKSYSLQSATEGYLTKDKHSFIPDEKLRDLDVYFSIERPKDFEPVIVVKDTFSEVFEVYEVNDETQKMQKVRHFDQFDVYNNIDDMWAKCEERRVTILIGGGKNYISLRKAEPIDFEPKPGLIATYEYKEIDRIE